MSIFLKADCSEKDAGSWENHFGNVKEYQEKYAHPLWAKKEEGKGLLTSGQGRIDALMLDDFITRIKENKPFSIDVYDMATWMSITCLSEQSIILGSMPQSVPDFTR